MRRFYQIAMLVIGIMAVTIGLVTDNDTAFIVGQTWLVGSIIVATIGVRRD